MAARNYSNIASTASLVGAIDASVGNVIVGDYTGFPAAPFTATIDLNTASEEVVLVTAVSGFTLAIQRGYDSTPSTAHAAGALFQHTSIALDLSEANSHNNATAGVHGATGVLVGTTSTQEITNKTFKDNTHRPTAITPGVKVVASGDTTDLFQGRNAADLLTVFAVSKDGDLTAKAIASTAPITGPSGTITTFNCTTLNATTVNAATLAASGAATVGGTLGVTGATTLAGAVAASLTIAGFSVSTGGAVVATSVAAPNVPKVIGHMVASIADTASTVVKTVAGTSIAHAWETTHLYQVVLNVTAGNEHSALQSIKFMIYRNDTATLIDNLYQANFAVSESKIIRTATTFQPSSAHAPGGQVAWVLRVSGTGGSLGYQTVKFTIIDLGLAPA